MVIGRLLRVWPDCVVTLVIVPLSVEILLKELRLLWLGFLGCQVTDCRGLSGDR